MTKQEVLDCNYIEHPNKALFRHLEVPFLQLCKVQKKFIFRAFGVTIGEVKNKKHLLTLTFRYIRY